MYDISKLIGIPLTGKHHLVMRNETLQANSTKLIRHFDAPLTSINITEPEHTSWTKFCPINHFGYQFFLHLHNYLREGK